MTHNVSMKDTPTWGLEYLLLFGLPENKLEIIDGRTRCVFPFHDRATASAHLGGWLETICRWKQAPAHAIEAAADRVRRIQAAGFELAQHPGPIEIRIPVVFRAFERLYCSSWCQDARDPQPPGQLFGLAGHMTHSDVRMNLWRLLDGACSEHGGCHSSRVDISLSDTAAVSPDAFYYRHGADCMIRGEYFRGAPALVAEVLEPATRALDRGARKDLYGRSGVERLWLLDPATETVERYRLEGRRLEPAGFHGTGETFREDLFPGIPVSVDDLFDTQWKRNADRWRSAAKGPAAEEQAEAGEPGWLLPRELRLGLEYLLLMGHPDRRREIRDNRTECVLAFDAGDEARLRLGHFLEDICRWEGLPEAKPQAMSPEVDVAEVGRFRLSRHGSHVRLEVIVDGRKYRDLLGVWADRAAWDWGDEAD